MSGGNPLIGAVLGGVEGAIGGSLFDAFGGVASNGLDWANFVAGVKTGAVVGAAFGGISTAIHGGNFFKNVALGALSGAVSSAAAFGIMKGATETYAAAKEWWNSMPGTGAASKTRGRVALDVDPGNVPKATNSPVINPRFTSQYDPKGLHPMGVDMVCQGGGCGGVYATGEGAVEGMRSTGEYLKANNFVQVRIEGGYSEVYAHVLPAEGLTIGGRVQAGQLIGTTDLTGNTTGLHLHYELRQGNNNYNPCLRLGC